MSTRCWPTVTDDDALDALISADEVLWRAWNDPYLHGSAAEIQDRMRRFRKLYLVAAGGAVDTVTDSADWPLLIGHVGRRCVWVRVAGFGVRVRRSLSARPGVVIELLTPGDCPIAQRGRSPR